MDEIDFAAERIENFNSSALQAVLSRMSQAPSNGICRSCGAEIEADRLKANPRARNCCECAAEEEEMARRAKLCGPR